MGKNNALKRKEHEAVRNSVGYYDFTHELIEAKGPAATEFLDKVFVNSMAKANIGDAIYTTMLNEDGIIIDDIIVFRLEENNYLISTLYADQMVKHFDSYSAGLDVEYKDVSSTSVMYAVQGPNSGAVLNEILAENIDALKVFTIKDNKIDNVDISVARCGFTGELGYELYFAPEHRDLVESKLNAAGAAYDIVKLTTDVTLSSIPTEKGYIIMRDVAGTNPMEAGLGFAVDWSKDFVGKAALEKAKAAGVTRKLVGFTVEDDNAQAGEGDEVKVNGQTAGKVTNFTYGYTVEKNIGYALIDTNVAKIGDKATIVSNGKEIEATLTKRVFYDAEDARRTEAAKSAVK